MVTLMQKEGLQNIVNALYVAGSIKWFGLKIITKNYTMRSLKMDKISFLKSIREVEFDDNGNLKSIKGYVERSTDDY